MHLGYVSQDVATEKNHRVGELGIPGSVTRSLLRFKHISTLPQPFQPVDHGPPPPGSASVQSRRCSGALHLARRSVRPNRNLMAVRWSSSGLGFRGVAEPLLPLDAIIL